MLSDTHMVVWALSTSSPPAAVTLLPTPIQDTRTTHIAQSTRAKPSPADSIPPLRTHSHQLSFRSHWDCWMMSLQGCVPCHWMAQTQMSQMHASQWQPRVPCWFKYNKNGHINRLQAYKWGWKDAPSIRTPHLIHLGASLQEDKCRPTASSARSKAARCPRVRTLRWPGNSTRLPVQHRHHTWGSWHWGTTSPMIRTWVQ